MQAGQFDGTRRQIDVVPDEATVKTGVKEFADVIAFADGKFVSTALSAKGFKPAVYRSDFEEKEAEFEVEQASDAEGIVTWLGEFHGDQVAGSLQWEKGGSNLLFLHTDNFRRDYESYKSKGVVFVRQPKEEVYGTVAVFQDLYGNLWDLVQPKQAKGTT